MGFNSQFVAAAQNSEMHDLSSAVEPRFAVDAKGFTWNGKIYPSLSQVAFAITGTRWNGPRFFGLRDKPSKGSSA